METRVSSTILAASLAVAACSSAEDRAAHEGLTLQQIMRDKVDTNAHALWDATNPALDDQVGLDPAEMSDDAWTELDSRSAALEQGALAIARMHPIVVVRPGQEVADAAIEGAYSAAQVQAAIDADPAKLREMATSLAMYSGLLSAAADVRDARAAGKLIEGLNDQCESCHLDFWYPGQKDLLASGSGE